MSNLRAPFIRDRVRGGTWSKKDCPHIIFGSEIPHDELVNVVYLFCSDLLLFSRKFAKIVQDADHHKNGGSMNTRTSLVKTEKARSLFFNLYICVRSIGRLFTPKPRIHRLILNSRRVFKNQL